MNPELLDGGFFDPADVKELRHLADIAEPGSGDWADGKEDE